MASTNWTGIIMVVSVVLLLSFRDLTVSHVKKPSSDNNNKNNDQISTATTTKKKADLHTKDEVKHENYKDDKFNVDEPRLKSRFKGPTLRFLYCYSCGYKRAYDEFYNIVHERYPTIVIEGLNYQPSVFNTCLAQILNIFKLALIVCVVSGCNPFNMLGLNTPSVYVWALQNKIYAGMMLYFLGNAIESHLVSTGAFEILYNDLPVWSKLEVGRIPNPTELLQIIDSQMRLSISSHSTLNPS